MKIALIAMSGVRVRSKELAELGVTLPGFVQRSKVIASLPSLGLLTIAGATPPGHDLAYFEHGDVTPEALASRGFDLVAVSTFTAQAPEAYAFLDACRAVGLTTVMGGLHASVLPEEAALHADHVVAGEGEEAWPELVADVEAGRARRVYDARGRVFPLERSPEPRYDLLDPERYNRLTVQTTRSCPRRCTFCASGVLLRGPYRKKPLDLVARDLEAIRRVWHRPFLELADDNTFVDPAWGIRLARRIGEFGLRWFTETEVTVADHEDLLEALAASGCRQLLVGLEALDVRTVAGLEDRAFKRTRVPDYADAVRRIQSHGISVNGCFVLGADDEAPGAVGRIARFARAAGLAEVQVTVLTPFPGTPLYARLLAQGRILRPGDWGGATLFDVTFEPAQGTVEDLEASLRDAFRLLYAPQVVKARRRAFHRQVRQGRRARAGAPRAA